MNFHLTGILESFALAFVYPSFFILLPSSLRTTPFRSSWCPLSMNGAKGRRKTVLGETAGPIAVRSQSARSLSWWSANAARLERYRPS